MKGKRLFGRAFTLIELLVVMGIIGMLVMLLMPVVNYAFVVAQRVVTGNTIKHIETGLAGFYGDFGVYPPSDDQHEVVTDMEKGAAARGYKNLALCLKGPEGTGWGSGSDSNKMPFGGPNSTVKFGPYFEGEVAASGGIDDAFKPAKPILYFRYEQSGDPEATVPTNPVYDFNDNEDTTGALGFPNQGNLMMLLRRRGTYQYVRRDYVLISAGPDGLFGYWVDPDGDGVYASVTPSDAMKPAAGDYTGAYCDDVTNFKYEQY